MFGRSRGSSSSNSYDKVDKLFLKYKEEKEDEIGVRGTEQLCEDLGVDPSDPLVLALAWRLGADTMCRFTRTQWRSLAAYGVKSMEDLRKLLPSFMDEAQRDFDSFYAFTYSFGLDKEKGERVLPAVVALPLWQLVFSAKQKSPHLSRWLEFLERRGTRGITRDTWDLYLLFTRTIKEDLSNYNEMEAWPSLLDEFVEEQREQAHG